MINLRQYFGTMFTIRQDDWTSEDTDDLKMLLSHPKFSALTKLIHRRITARNEDLINGSIYHKESRARIDELKDLILELQNYENS